jgi:tetratricopeptide (TPR) repeat protein
MKYDVFISYSTKDRIIAEKVQDALKEQGISSWMAPASIAPGSDWMIQITEAIKQSKVIVIVLSSAANQSVHVPREAQLALKYKCDYIPYRIQDIHPEGALEYCLACTHYLDAIQPSSTDSQNLKLLCNVVKKAVDNPQPNQEHKEKSLFEDAVPKSLRLKLADAMIRQKHTVVCMDAFPPEEKEAFEKLELCGRLVSKPNFINDHKKYVAPAKKEDCYDLLVEWIIEQNPAPQELLDDTLGFNPLLESAAKVCIQKLDTDETALISDYASRDKADIEYFVKSLLEFSDQAGPQNDVVSGRIKTVVSLVLVNPSLYAVRGLLIGAQRLVNRSRPNLAIYVYDQMDQWAKNREQDSEIRRILTETASERARVEIRLGQIDIAENRIRTALEWAKSLNDPTLIGIVSNNLANVLLENSFQNELRVKEAIQILEENIRRLNQESQKVHLAAAYSNLGDAVKKSDPKKAGEYYRKDIDICLEMKEELSASDAMHSYQNFLMFQNKPELALQESRKELAILERIFDPRRQARALANEGRAYFKCWKNSEESSLLEHARQSLESSKKWFITASNEPKLFAPALELLGQVFIALGKKEEGIHNFEEAIEQYKALPYGQPIIDEISDYLSQLD